MGTSTADGKKRIAVRTCNPTASVVRLGVGALNLKEEMNVRILRSNSNRYQVRLIAVALLAALGLVAAGCGGSSASSAPKGGVAGPQHSTSGVAVKTRKIKGLGVVLIKPNGRTLYVFMKDAHRHVTCTGSCASFWPPLKWKSCGQADGRRRREELAARHGQEPQRRQGRDVQPLAALHLLR